MVSLALNGFNFALLIRFMGEGMLRVYIVHKIENEYQHCEIGCV